MVELRRCLLSIEPPRSKRRRPGAVRCPGIVKSTPLLRQTASVVARLARLAPRRSVASENFSQIAITECVGGMVRHSDA